MDRIDQLDKDIKNLAIQGATDIALAVLEGMKIAIESGNSKDDILKIGNKLAYARPTEPLAQNSLRFIFSSSNKDPASYLNKITEYQALISQAKEEMAENASPLIQNGGTYLTHCHSSTVVSMFVKAKKQGKKFSVFATETRPKFQGHITVNELLEAGVEDVTLIIDDVAESLIEGRVKHINGVFIGADLLTEKGFINKVGSLGIAYACQRNQIPLHCLSILLKFSPKPFSQKLLEVRSGYEIWKDAPEKLSFYAPAFDYIPFSSGAKLVCEKGILENQDIAKEAYSLYPFLKE